MQRHNVYEKYLKIIAEMTKNNITKIKTGNILTKAVPITTSIQQRDNLSSVLFNLIMDEIIKSVKDIKAGYNMGNNTIQILCYADDAMLFTKREDDLQKLLYRFITTSSIFNMSISIKIQIEKIQISNSQRIRSDVS